LFQNFSQSHLISYEMLFNYSMKERKCLTLATKIEKRICIIIDYLKQHYTVHNSDRLFYRHASLERSKEGWRARKRENAGTIEPGIKWSVMDRTRQLQIVPFSSEFLSPHAISGRDTEGEVKGISILQTTWHSWKKCFR